MNSRKEIIGVCLSDLKLVIDLESSIRGMFFQFDISEILGVYEDVGYVFLGVYSSLCRNKYIKETKRKINCPRLKPNFEFDEMVTKPGRLIKIFPFQKYKSSEK